MRFWSISLECNWWCRKRDLKRTQGPRSLPEAVIDHGEAPVRAYRAASVPSANARRQLVAIRWRSHAAWSTMGSSQPFRLSTWRLTYACRYFSAHAAVDLGAAGRVDRRRRIAVCRAAQEIAQRNRVAARTGGVVAVRRRLGGLPQAAVALVVWAVGAAAALALCHVARLWAGVRWSAPDRRLMVAGSWMPMVLILAGVVRHQVRRRQLTMALHPEVVARFAFLLPLVYGLFSGMFAARSVAMWRAWRAHR